MIKEPNEAFEEPQEGLNEPHGDAGVDNDERNGKAGDSSNEISEAMRIAVAKVREKKTKNGKVYGVKNKEDKRITPKMRLFSSLVAQGHSPKEAYKKAYDVRTTNEAVIQGNANKLMKDGRISGLMESVWDSVKENIVDDQVAARRKIMGDLLKHADNETNRLGDRLKALELMGKAIGMFTDRVESKIEEIDSDKLKRELDGHIQSFNTAKMKASLKIIKRSTPTDNGDSSAQAV